MTTTSPFKAQVPAFKAQVFVQGFPKAAKLPKGAKAKPDETDWEANLIPVKVIEADSPEACWKKAKSAYVAPVLQFLPA